MIGLARSILSGAALIVVPFAVAGGIAAAQAVQPVHAFDIPAGPLGAAIARIGRQAETMIVADPALLRQRQTRGVQGRFTAAEALARALEGTGLSARFDGNGGFVLIGVAVADAESTSAPTSGDVVVTASRAVTATKTDTPLIETPQSVSVITADQLLSRGAIGLQEALRYTAGLRTESNGADYRFDYVTARGGFEAAQFVDGLHRPDSAYVARTEVFNLERVEALRGPSSVLYGQGAAGGIINSITKRPDFTTRGEAEVQYGSFNRVQGQFDLTGALDADQALAARLVGLVRHADNQVDYGKDNRTMLAPSLRFRPDDRTDIVLAGLYQKDEAASTLSYMPVLATLLAQPGQRLARDLFLGEPSNNASKNRELSATLQVRHRFSDAIQYSGSLRESAFKTYTAEVDLSVWDGLVDPFLDEDRRILGRTLFNWQSRTRMFTADNNLRFDFTTGPFTHKLLVGVDYLRASLRSYEFDAEVDPIDIYAPVYTGVPDGDLSANPHEISSQLGIYLQDQIRFADRVTLVLGGRRDRAATTLDGTDKEVDKASTFRAGLVVDLGAGLSPYVSYSESFQPTLGVNFYGERFVPQRGTQYEAGLKWQPDHGTLLTVAAFHIKGTNRLQTDPTNVDNQIQQGEVTSRGIEVEASRTIAKDFTISLSYSYIDAKISKSTEPLEIGEPIPAVAKNSASMWGEKRLALRRDVALRLGAGVRYTGSSMETAVFYDVDPAGLLDRQGTPGFTLADALVALDWKRWSLAVNATNLFDKHYYGSCSVRSACGVGYARNIIGTLGFRF